MTDHAGSAERSDLLPVPALVLAGGKTSPEFAAAAGVSNRVLAEIHGLPMIRYVLRALRQARTVSRVLVIGPARFPAQPEADEQVEADGDLPANILAGLRHCPGAPYVLIATADIPFVTPAAIDDHLRACAAACAEGTDCCWSAIPRAACERQFPGMRRTYVRTLEDSFTSGNVVFQRAAVFERQAALLREAYVRRKNPLFLARLIGMRNVLKLLARRLSLREIEQAASGLFDVRCRILVTPHACLGTDIDRPDDLLLARVRLAPSPPGSETA